MKFPLSRKRHYRPVQGRRIRAYTDLIRHDRRGIGRDASLAIDLIGRIAPSGGAPAPAGVAHGQDRQGAARTVRPLVP
jgi:hypothetical protein